MEVIPAVAVPLSLSAARLTYYIKTDRMVKGSFFIIVLENLDKMKSYQLRFIGKETNRYDLRIIQPHTLKLIAMPLSFPDRARLVLLENNEPVMEDVFSLSERSVPSLSLSVEQKYVSPPPELMKRIEEEQRLAGKVKKTFREKVLFFQKPVYPVEPFELSTVFGARRIFNRSTESVHYGVDVRASRGTPVRAVFDGIVEMSRDLYFAGKTVFLHHGDDLLSMYCHLEKSYVTNSQFVAKGEVLGTVGSTGRVTGPHLHMGLFINGIAVDPMSIYEILK